MANKSGIHIKKSHEGRLTAKAKSAGKSIAGEASSALKPGSKATKATREQAQFYENIVKPNKKKKKK